MAGDEPLRWVTDGGTDHGVLFEALPDPVIGYAVEPGTGENTTPDGNEAVPGNGNHDRNGNESDGDEAVRVVTAVNGAFEDRFDSEGEELRGKPLGEVELSGTVVEDPVGEDGSDHTDPAETPDESSTTTAESLLERAREAEPAVAFEGGTGDGTGRFRVRSIHSDTTDGSGYLVFTDVTDLERRREDLAETAARLERLASVASHDLRNPLEVAEIRLEAARDTGDDVHFEKVAGALDRIEHIVRDVLAVGGSGVDPTDTVALGDVAEAAWETVDTADAELATADALPTVRGDRERLRQLFENLFRNAVEHAGPDVTVTVTRLPEGFAVVDDGPGLPPAVLERGFEAGFSTDPENSGLGLSIVRQIARGHGWQVSPAAGPDDSGGDAGARFEFRGVERVGQGEEQG